MFIKWHKYTQIKYDNDNKNIKYTTTNTKEDNKY